jgi:uncharacterized protein YbaR (Trm112 family)
MTAHSASFDPTVIDQLACPACHGSLALVEQRLVCQGCAHAYPIVDGIPVLIAERAHTSGSSE